MTEMIMTAVVMLTAMSMMIFQWIIPVDGGLIVNLVLFTLSFDGGLLVSLFKCTIALDERLVVLISLIKCTTVF